MASSRLSHLLSTSQSHNLSPQGRYRAGDRNTTPCRRGTHVVVCEDSNHPPPCVKATQNWFCSGCGDETWDPQHQFKAATRSIYEWPPNTRRNGGMMLGPVKNAAAWFSKIAHLESFFICPKESITTCQHWNRNVPNLPESGGKNWASPSSTTWFVAISASSFRFDLQRATAGQRFDGLIAFGRKNPALGHLACHLAALEAPEEPQRTSGGRSA